ncbi:MAG: hypothetical protein ACTSYX_04845 [Candidatus Thorarchaeota archaeon]
MNETIARFPFYGVNEGIFEEMKMEIATGRFFARSGNLIFQGATNGPYCPGFHIWKMYIFQSIKKAREVYAELTSRRETTPLIPDPFKTDVLDDTETIVLGSAEGDIMIIARDFIEEAKLKK